MSLQGEPSPAPPATLAGITDRLNRLTARVEESERRTTALESIATSVQATLAELRAMYIELDGRTDTRHKEMLDSLGDVTQGLSSLLLQQTSFTAAVEQSKQQVTVYAKAAVWLAGALVAGALAVTLWVFAGPGKQPIVALLHQLLDKL